MMYTEEVITIPIAMLAFLFVFGTAVMIFVAMLESIFNRKR